MRHAVKLLKYVKDLKVIIFHNRTNTDFVTCDNPAVLTNRFFFQRLKLSSFGISSSGTILSIPMSPRMSAICYDNSVYSVPNATGTHVVDITNTTDILSINQLQYLTASKNSAASERAAGQPRRPLAAGEAVRLRGGTLPTFATNFLRLAQARGWTRKPARPGRASLTCRRLRQLQRPDDRRGGRRRPAPQRRRGLCPARAGRLRHGVAGLRRRGNRAESVQTTCASWPNWPAQGFPILCSEPTAAVMFRQDARRPVRRRRRPSGRRPDGRVHGLPCRPAPRGPAADRLRPARIARSVITCPATSRRWAGRRRPGCWR